MAELKTKVNNASVTDFINSVKNEQKRKDSFILLDLFKKITKEPSKMWGPSIIGFGMYHYKSDRSAQEGDWMLTGFSPRVSALTLYIFHGLEDHSDLLSKLGKYKTGKGCMYINKLSDVDLNVLEKLIKLSFENMVKANKA